MIHADGAFGGIAPSGNLHFALYNERKAIPKETEIEVTEDGPQTEKTIDSLEGFVREIETDVVMDINAALNLHKWLGTKLEALRQALKISDEEWDKMRNGTE